MLNKLALRNAKRSMKDYLIYLLTMALVTALMFAFHSLIFSPSVQKLYMEAGIMAAMIGAATFFVVIIIVWLVHYMVKFLAEKRSREFATYMLLGFPKKQIAALFLKENMVLGAAAFLLGLLPGLFLQQVLVTLIYAMIESQYKLRLEINVWTFLLTAGMYALSFVLSLFRNKKRFQKMNIHDMMYMDKQNEALTCGNRSGRKWLLLVSVGYILFFGWMLYQERFNRRNAYLLAGGLAAAIYLLYMGLAAYLAGYIRKGRTPVWRQGNLFVLRQLSSKIKTMQFTLGTLTVLFTAALVGCACALMLNFYLSTVGDEKWPFDVAIYQKSTDTDFTRELEVIRSKAQILEQHACLVYQDGSDAMNRFLMEKNGGYEDWPVYFKYDTYMKLSDYNRLREMLGYGCVSLGEREYLIHAKFRLKDWMEEFSGRTLAIQGRELACAGIYTEGFEQNGHNGADYLFIVPDETADGMVPYYSLLEVQLSQGPQEGLGEELKLAVEETQDWESFGYRMSEGYDYGYGSDIIYMDVSLSSVRDEKIPKLKIMLSTVIFPLFYIGLVFLCAALTILAVQQLSDSGKYRFRYGILRKLGMKEREVNRVILKQLVLYYLCPFAGAFLLSAEIVGFLSVNFNYLSGAKAPVWSYMGWSVLLFGAVYLLYFIVTYVEFKRNV